MPYGTHKTYVPLRDGTIEIMIGLQNICIVGSEEFLVFVKVSADILLINRFEKLAFSEKYILTDTIFRTLLLVIACLRSFSALLRFSHHTQLDVGLISSAKSSGRKTLCDIDDTVIGSSSIKYPNFSESRIKPINFRFSIWY